MPRAIERPEDSAGTGLAVREMSVARSRPAEQQATPAIPRIKNEAAVVLAKPVTWQAYQEAGMLSLEQQLPQLRSRDQFYPLDKYSPPSLVSTLDPSVLEWKTVFFAVRQLLVNATMQLLIFTV